MYVLLAYLNNEIWHLYTVIYIEGFHRVIITLKLLTNNVFFDDNIVAHALDSI